MAEAKRPSFQDMILTLQRHWAEQGCLILPAGALPRPMGAAYP
ncbi:hypothetical protein [Hankyongella ginsenosidimutans]|nr:hypothetical protein [Hankyongella ginsenosidimutans]